MRLIIITPYGVSTKREDVLNIILNWGEPDNGVYTKKVIVTSELAEKHFDFLPAEQRKKVAAEWAGQTVEAFILKTVPQDKIKSLKEVTYISPDDIRALRDILLWFPEVFL